MTNGEKYRDEIKEQLLNNNSGSFCDDFIKPKILKRSCCGISCSKCCLIQALWLIEEYKEPVVDWSKVPVDTNIFVKDYEDDHWLARCFAKYADGRVFAFTGGKTSFTSAENDISDWKFAKLAEVEDEKP